MTDGDRSTHGEADRATEGGGEDESENAETDGGREEHLAHLADVEDGCGCAEVWEHLSETRSEGVTGTAED